MEIPDYRGFRIFTAMSFISFNSKLIADDQPVIQANHRGLRYGDGLFETIKFKKQQLILIDDHLDRLWQGASLLQFQLPKLLTKDALKQQIHLLIKKNKLNEARVRLAFYRNNGGLYDAIHHQPDVIIEALPLPSTNGTLNTNGLHCCIYPDAKKTIDQFSSFKHNNFLPYLMGALFAQQKKCNDAIILNQEGNICDSTIANVFFIKNNQIFTPSLDQGCIAGIMRKFIILQLHQLGYQVTESKISIQDLLEADEIFLSNSIYNIRWVAMIGDHSYHNHQIQNIFSQLAQTNKDVFC